MMDEREHLAMQIPAIELGNVKVSVLPVPAQPSLKQLVIGPLFLSLPLDEEARKILVRGLTGIFLPDVKTNGEL